MMTDELKKPSWQPHWLAEVCGGRWRGPVETPITGVSNDSRTLTPGSLYVALKGPRFDGHDFVADALNQGAAGCLVDAAWQGQPGAPLLEVPDTRRGLGDWARAYRKEINPLTIGITGSVGKSTVKQMLAHLLAGVGTSCATRGNWNNDIGLPLSLLSMSASCRYGVYELGTNHPGEIAGLCDVLCPDVGIVTNVGPVHCERFGAVDNIAREKAALLASLPPDGVAVIDADGDYSELLTAAANCRVVTIGETAESVTFRIAGYDVHQGCFDLVRETSGKRVSLCCGLPGRHHIVGAALAAVAAGLCGCSWELIAERLPTFHHMPMRWQVCSVGDCLVVNDAYNANPVSMRAALETFKTDPAVSGRRWLVLGEMLEMGEQAVEKHLELGVQVAAGPWAGCVGVGPLAKHLLQAAEEQGMPAEHLFSAADSDAAARWLSRRIHAGDAVLLKASRGLKLERIVDALMELN